MSSGGNAVMTNTQLAAEFNVNEIETAYVHVNDATQATTVGTEAAKMMTQVSGVKTGHFYHFLICLNRLLKLIQLMA